MINDEILRVASDDILYRLRQEQQERAESIRMWRASAQAGSIRDDDHIHGLTKEAADEIVRLRFLLAQTPDAVM